MSDFILHEHPLSPYAQKIRIMLREKGIDFQAQMPTGLGSGVDDGSFARLNPRLEVPALVTGGAVLYDSTIILEYLEETHPSPRMLPEAPLDRAQARTIEDICDTHWEAINWGLGELRFFKRGDGELAVDLRRAAVEQVGHMHGWLAAQLGGRIWLNGATFGWADLCALPFVTMSEMFGIAPPTGSPLADWLARGRARPSVAVTVAEAEATLPGMDRIAALIADGGFRRQFRDHRLEWMIRSGGIQVVLDGLADDDIRFTELNLFTARTA